MIYKLGSRLSAKLELTKYENVSVENWLEINDKTGEINASSEEMLDFLEIELEKDAAPTLAQLQSLVTAKTLAEWKDFHRSVKKMAAAGRFTLT